MKKLLLIITLISSLSHADAAKKPEWINNKPTDDDHYIGVGYVAAASADRDRLAKEKALADLISEIQVIIEQKSLFERMDENGKYSEKYTNDIRSGSQAWLEGYELADTYNDGAHYWVMYRLNKATYAELKKAKSAEAAQMAFELWQKGNKSLKEGNIVDAAAFYTSGIRAIEPFANMRLEVVADGTTMNMGAELLYSISSAFSQFNITCTPSKIKLPVNEAKATEVLLRVRSGDNDLAGIDLDVSMKPGTAKVAISGLTDRSGHARVSISEVSAKPIHRTLTIDPLLNFNQLFDTPALKMIAETALRSIKPINVAVEVKSSALKAICVAADTEAQQLTGQIAQFINAGYFDMAQSEDDADLKVEVSESCRPGKTVEGDMYEMREYFSSAQVTVTDLNTNKTVATVAIDNMRTLSPATASATKARSDARRQMMGRIKKALNTQLPAAKLQRRQSMESDAIDEIRQSDNAEFFSNEYE